MANKIHETIIIGAGIAGLACARRLHENGKDFLVISEDIGGRCGGYSENGVPYGAYFVMDNYYNFKKFVRIERKINPLKIRFHDGNGGYSLMTRKLMAHPFQSLKLLFMVIEYAFHHENFKRKCETMSQTEAMKSDPYFYDICTQSAKEYVQKQKIRDISENVIEPLLLATCVSPLHKCQANHLLWMCLLALIPSYEFVFLRDEIIKGFEKRIKIDSVNRISKEGNNYIVKTKSKSVKSKNIVVATPPHISKKLLALKEIREPVYLSIFHIAGKVRERYDNCMINLMKDDSIYGMARHKDGTFVVISEKKNPRFEDYFYNYKIIHQKFWGPAANMGGDVFWECEIDQNLYLIGDHNANNLEDTCISGLYVANQILKSGWK
jgi:protoporphyrinogen oxidase